MTGPSQPCHRDGCEAARVSTVFFSHRFHRCSGSLQRRKLRRIAVHRQQNERDQLYMPRSPPVICNAPGCANLAGRGGRCEHHQHVKRSRNHRAEDAGRQTASQRGYDWAWQKLSSRYRKSHPLCEMYCAEQGRLTPTEIVDHIVPVDVRPDLRLVESNLQSGCKRCNARKAIEDEKRYGPTGARGGEGGQKIHVPCS